MATQYQNIIATKGAHAVGHMNTMAKNRTTVSHGAEISTADVDNFTIVEDAGYSATTDSKLVKQLSNKANGGYLVTTAERRYLGEDLAQFYNAVGEKANLDVIKPFITRFRTSAYSLNAGVTAPAKGQVAHFDVVTKKFILSASGTPHADYATSKLKFEVMADLDDTAGEFDVNVVGLVSTAV